LSRDRVSADDAPDVGTRASMLGLVALVACSADAPRRAPPSAGRDAPDKAALFGDPVLVPTRDGEVARRELAAAGEIAAAIEATHWITDVHVDVEAKTAKRQVVRVVIAGRVPADRDEAVLRGDLASIVDGVLGRDDARTLVLALGHVPVEPAPRDRPALALVLAAMGFGASAGIAIDRALRRRRALARARARSRRAA
jgi:hypothetical protein